MCVFRMILLASLPRTGALVASSHSRVSEQSCTISQIMARTRVKAHGMAWGGGGHASDDESFGEEDALRLERTKEYVKSLLFGGGSEWRKNRTLRHQGGVMSSSVNRGLSEVVTSLDTRDAMEACRGLEGDDKEECYVVFGVDKDADMWYDIVSKFDALLGLDTDPLEESVHKGQERV